MLNFGSSMTQGKKHSRPKMLILGASQAGLMRGIYPLLWYWSGFNLPQGFP